MSWSFLEAPREMSSAWIRISGWKPWIIVWYHGSYGIRAKRQSASVLSKYEWIRRRTEPVGSPLIHQVWVTIPNRATSMMEEYGQGVEIPIRGLKSRVVP